PDRAARATVGGRVEKLMVEPVAGERAEQARHQASEESAAAVTITAGSVASGPIASSRAAAESTEERCDQSDAQQNDDCHDNPNEPVRARALLRGMTRFARVVPHGARIAAVWCRRWYRPLRVTFQFLNFVNDVIDAVDETLVVFLVAKAGEDLVAQLGPLGVSKPLFARLLVVFNLHMSGVAADEDENPFRVLGGRPLAGPLLEEFCALGAVHLRDFVGLAGNGLECLNADFLSGFLFQIGEARVGRVESLLAEEPCIIFDFD